MKHLIDAYLEDHESAWAASTWKSERSRLRVIAPHLDMTPKDLHKFLEKQGKKPYTIKTIFIRLSDMEKWAKIEPKFKDYLEKHQNKFKHVYQKEELDVTFEDALRKINEIADNDCRAHALSLLHTGSRLSESYRVCNGSVVGKGGKVRKIYGKIDTTVPKSTLSRKLRAVSLKPHTLRKLCATRLAQMGATPADLCKVFGWSDIKTAYQYLQAREDSKLESLMETVKEGS